MHECAIMRNRFNSPQVWLSSSVQKWKQDIFSKVDKILENSDLDSLLSFLSNQLNHIGGWKLDWKSDNELKTYYFNVELVIKKIIDNKDFIAEIIWSKLSWEEYEKTREILEFASRINPNILEETGIWKVLLEIDELNQERIRRRIEEIQRHKNTKKWSKDIDDIKKEILLSPEDLRVLQEGQIVDEDGERGSLINETQNNEDENYKDLTQIIK